MKLKKEPNDQQTSYWIVLSQKPFDCPCKREASGKVVMPQADCDGATVAQIEVGAVKNSLRQTLKTLMSFRK